ncbi:hypothetical protein PSEUDO8O_30884 [Pseudomonas sp. 8O]|nr:hypothetical protein PSEUDO8O_30884 [Pseudomonas sp. 8O]
MLLSAHGLGEASRGLCSARGRPCSLAQNDSTIASCSHLKEQLVFMLCTEISSQPEGRGRRNPLLGGVSGRYGLRVAGCDWQGGDLALYWRGVPRCVAH